MSVKLIIDGNDTYQQIDDIFYIHPCRIGMVKHVHKNTFDSCEIKNSPLDSLTPLNLVTILDKLIPNGKMEIELDQPISVMQDYDAKQVEANVKLAGFDDITIDGNTIICTKPERRRSTNDIEITKTKVVKTSKRKYGQK